MVVVVFAAGFAIPTAGKLGGVHYMYGDELPKKITQALVCAVICSILGNSSYSDLYDSSDT